MSQAKKTVLSRGGINGFQVAKHYGKQWETWMAGEKKMCMTITALLQVAWPEEEGQGKSNKAVL